MLLTPKAYKWPGTFTCSCMADVDDAISLLATDGSPFWGITSLSTEHSTNKT